MYLMVAVPLSDFYLKGCGKTLFATMYAHRFKNYYKKIYANFHIKGLDNFQYISNEFLIELLLDEQYDFFEVHSLLIIDEISSLFDARRSMSNENVSFSHLLRLMRKRDIQILATDQDIMNLDKRIRRHINFVIKCRKLNPLDNNDSHFVYVYCRRDETPFHKEILDMKPYYDLYDTTEIPEGIFRIKKRIEEKKEEKKKKRRKKSSE